MTAPTVRDAKVFVPARDFAISKAFYLALGAHLNWENDRLAELDLGGIRFLLQNYYVKDWAENFMIYFPVDDASAWFRHVSVMAGSADYPGVRVNEPKDEPWGDTVTYVWDPSGVLLHFAQPRAISF